MTHHNPVSGETVTFLDTGPEAFRMEIRVPGGRGGMVGPLHFHPHQEERFQVLAGTPVFRLDSEERTAAPGDEVVVPIGGRHIFGNGGDEELVMVSEYRPGLRSTETFFETFFGLARETGRERPGALQSALTLWEVRDYFVVTSPPPAVQRVVFPLLASIARSRGLSPSYERFRAGT